MRIAVVGAGPSGLVTAAVLTQFGHEVTVLEKAPDLGGVWSSTRRYPDVSTQDDRVSYAFSDVPMPADFPLHPTGNHVRAYLEHYADVKGVRDRVRLGATVERAVPAGDGWSVQVRDAQGVSLLDVDWLVLANGVFSTPHVPDWPGRDVFDATGGQVVEPTQLGDGAVLAGRDVVVVGWGKTACDVAVAASRTARSTTVVARAVRWKVPKRIAGSLTFRHLLLTRLGEHLMAPERTTRFQTLLATVDAPVRRAVLWSLAQRIARRTGARGVGLLPDTPLPYADSLVTDGFFEAVRSGRITVRRERSITALGAGDVQLSDGSRVPADVVVAATGFDQDLSPLDASVRERLLDADGVMALHRRILPADVPRLAFAGWGNTYRSPLSAEVGAVWLAGHLAGVVPAPRRDEVQRTGHRFHLTHRQAAAHRQQQVPSGSFAVLDQMLDDLGLPLPAAVRRGQWTTPLTPASYAYLVPALRARMGAVTERASVTAH
ncbi:NAD(P)/FAD-dependent oxidoreductase [Kineococcus endophyticus]|uniref:NAD(P)/FAD-dependent oxidoreductase n=1 Tax=Kineococcus endophyticus TaxID=1181883 RepID=A0ABV3P2T8_9ACTN